VASLRLARATLARAATRVRARCTRRSSLPPHWRDRAASATTARAAFLDRVCDHREPTGAPSRARCVAVEVELQRKQRARLVGILQTYAELSAGEQPVYGGVIYITASQDIARAVRAAAEDVGLVSPLLSFRALPDVIEQTVHAASVLAEQRAAAAQDAAS